MLPVLDVFPAISKYVVPMGLKAPNSAKSSGKKELSKFGTLLDLCTSDIRNEVTCECTSTVVVVVVVIVVVVVVVLEVVVLVVVVLVVVVLVVVVVVVVVEVVVVVMCHFVSLFMAGAAFGQVHVSLFVAGAAFGEVSQNHCCR